MTANAQHYRLDGIYRQRQDGYFMQRVKLAAGVLSAAQARLVARVAEQFGQGVIHLTSRGSMEINWLVEADLPRVKRELASVGLTSRGACGGAVRGVSCASQAAAEFPVIERMAQRIHRHFTANPRFERLPKKFKIGVEADAAQRRHLIQDVGLLLSAAAGEQPCFDVYVAGGLGREPQPGFLLEAAVSEQRVIPLLEAVARVYAAHTPQGKRLKHLIREIGEERFRQLLAKEPGATEELPPVTGLPEQLCGTAVAVGGRVEVHVRNGQISSTQVRELAALAEQWCGGYLMVTTEQNIAFHLDPQVDVAVVCSALSGAGFTLTAPVFRVCPGTDNCLVALSDTRAAATAVEDVMPAWGRTLSWAISGCPNSCTQPQLADVGIVTSALTKEESGERTPRYDLYRAGDQPFATAIACGLTLQQLVENVKSLPQAP